MLLVEQLLFCQSKIVSSDTIAPYNLTLFTGISHTTSLSLSRVFFFGDSIHSFFSLIRTSSSPVPSLISSLFFIANQAKLKSNQTSSNISFLLQKNCEYLKSQNNHLQLHEIKCDMHYTYKVWNTRIKVGDGGIIFFFFGSSPIFTQIKISCFLNGYNFLNLFE